MPSALKDSFLYINFKFNPNQVPVKLPASYFNQSNYENDLYKPESIVSAILISKYFQRPQSEYDYIALDTRRGQRAMIIKNNDGDWGVLLGSWVDRRKAAAKSR